MGGDGMVERVNVDNFVRAETARMFDANLGRTGGVNSWWHLREPVPLDAQTVIRMNRDTLYSVAVADISEGATLSIPDTGERYCSVMVIDEDHHINGILRDPGEHALSVAAYGTPHVFVAARVFADPTDPGDIAAANAIQDSLRLESASATPYTHPEYDTTSLDATRGLLLELFEGLPDARSMFGAASDVDPVRHLVGTAFGWGGLPETEAIYITASEPRAAEHHQLTLRDVPVDGFWSLTVYNRDGYFEPNPYNAYSLNGVTSDSEADGSVTIDLDVTDEGYRNFLYVMDGWNYVLRLYRPRAEILDGTWVAPTPSPTAR